MIRQLIIAFLKEFFPVKEKESKKTPTVAEKTDAKYFEEHMAALRASNAPMGSLEELKKSMEKPSTSNGTQIGQFMTTHAMRKDLRDLGYNKFQIDALSPDEAAERIKEQKGPNG